jgi:dipeptidyl aminopeptidase/acylaminoacyl peptidase
MRQKLTNLILLLTVLGLTLHAQTKPAPQPADYGQWEALVTPMRGSGLSPDGKWLAYVINRSNGNNELRIARVDGGIAGGSAEKIVAFGTQAVFSADSHWAAYSIGYSETAADKLRADKKPVQNKLGLLDLASGEQVVVENIQSFAFSPAGTWLAMRRYPPEAAGGGDAPAPGRGGGGRGGAGAGAAASEDDNPASATLIVRQLAGGRDTAFGNVSDYAWQDLKHKGHLLAMAISVEDKTGNGVQLFDAETGALNVLDSSASIYTGLAWRKDSADLAALKSKADDKRDGPTYIALAWTRLGEKTGEVPPSTFTYDPTKDAKFPAGTRTVSYRKPTWSQDGDIVFLGLAEWPEKPPTAKKDAEDPAGVSIWHWRDTEVNPLQQKRATQDRQRNMLAAWHVGAGKLVPLGHALTEQITPLKHQKQALAADWKSYAMERTIGRPAADLYLVDLATGERSKLRDHLSEDHYVQASPNGRYLIYFENDHYWTINVSTKAVTNITKNVKTSFVNKESDETIKQKPAFGVAGWTKDDAAVLLYDKFDLWRVTPDGASATRLTDGAGEQVRHRYVRLDPDEEFIDDQKPVYVSLFGIWTKKSGYGRLTKAGVERLLWDDKDIGRLGKASDADVFQYVSETFVDSPNIFVGGADLKDAKQVTKTNPFQSNYSWSRSELIEYKNAAGERLQGALYYPAGYEAGKKYPMVVYMYEKLSDGIHRYSPLSERAYYNPSAITSHGYFLLMPDIVFRPREPGLSVADCVEAAVKKVVAMGAVDPKKVGVLGHSWGGFDSVFLATHSKMFGAAVAGAPITDLVSNYGNHHWSSGIAETDHIETGQQRMEVPLYEDLPAYIRNSAVFNVQNMTTPLLIEVGDADGTVFFHQGVELYNIARRAKKEVVLIEYAGEDHGLRKKADQMDYQHRIFEWFGHYLKDEPAAGWITEGQSYLDRQQEVKKLKAQ